MTVDINFDFDVLGTITDSEIDFDVEPFVPEEVLVVHNQTLLKYSDSQYKQDFFRRSLLQANGLHFVNPMPKPKEHLEDRKLYYKELENWQEAENNLIEKLLIIQPK